MKLFEFVNLGGPINWILFFMLCFCLCQCIERCLYFHQTSRAGKKYFKKRLEDKINSEKNLSPEELQKFVEKETSLTYYEMNRGLWFLNFVCSVSPSIGLLGTVVGLISAFQQIASAGSQVSMQDLSSGIWVAMITTAFGMMISIPGLFFYRTFKRIIEKRMMIIDLEIVQNLQDGKSSTNSKE
ncbi:MotA/TolQ/ExbB proton channel family protein [Treponema pectinovorum]|uniref:MotA/TolQ/ExbB proton channel family protein n=1 Tax=Treponema pectinovorum TaxID=164 RepID=UPI0011CC1105|nr:MotA/TolQ/ExbB proton channel family protein [Treponema pectinovorum]